MVEAVEGRMTREVKSVSWNCRVKEDGGLLLVLVGQSNDLILYDLHS